MSWEAVARKDFRDAIRSKMFWALAIIFGLFALGAGGVVGYYDLGGGSSLVTPAYALVSTVSLPVSLFVILTTVIICHKAIVQERESGSIKILLSLPHTRLDIVIGKIVGRTAVLAVPALGSMILGVGVGVAFKGGIEVGTLLAPLFVVLAKFVVLIATYASLMVGLSAMTKSKSIATFVGVGYFIVFEIVWNIVVFVIFLLALGTGNPRTGVSWSIIVGNVPPSDAIGTLQGMVMKEVTEVPIAETGAQFMSESAAWYATPWIAVPIVVFWIVVPAAVGYWRFESADL